MEPAGTAFCHIEIAEAQFILSRVRWRVKLPPSTISDPRDLPKMRGTNILAIVQSISALFSMDGTVVDQIAIALTGVAACWLSQDTRTRFARWACLFGLLSQPFYFYATYAAEQWGMFVASVAFTFAWIRGLYNFWLKPWRAARAQHTGAAKRQPEPQSHRFNWNGPKSTYRPWPQND